MTLKAALPSLRLLLIVCLSATVTLVALKLTGSLRAADTRLRPESVQSDQAEVPEARPHEIPPTITCAPTRVSIGEARLAMVEVVERTGSNLSGEGVRRQVQEILFDIENRTDVPVTAMLIGVSDPGSNVEWILDSGAGKDGAAPVIPAQGRLEYRVPGRAIAQGQVLEVRAVLFADGSSDGEPYGVKTLRDAREASGSADEPRAGGPVDGGKAR